jgi:hypothetical protein
MVFSEIIKEYNLNLIDLNCLLEEKIELEISNFLYENHLNLKLNSRDLRNIFKHFILKEILFVLDQEYDNILFFNSNFNLKYLHFTFNEEECIAIINDILKKSTKIFNFLLHEPIKDVKNDLKSIYKLKIIVKNKKTTDFRKIRTYIQNSNLTELSDKIKNNLQTMLSLNK